MAYFNKKKGIIKEPWDFQYETPYFVKHFWEWVLNDNKFDDTLPKAKKVNLLK